jgi:hypothetical protein
MRLVKIIKEWAKNDFIERIYYARRYSFGYILDD